MHGSDLALQFKGAVALVADAGRDAVYQTMLGTASGAGRTRRLDRRFVAINPAEFQQDHAFLQKMEEYDVLISGGQTPYVEPGCLRHLHGHSVPMIRICHLREGEETSAAGLRMRLPKSDEYSTASGQSDDRPIVLSQYQVDKDMEQVIFGQDPADLTSKVVARLKKIQPRDLVRQSKPASIS